MPTRVEPGPLVAHINQDHGLTLQLVRAFDGGETRSAHLLRDGDGREWVLKWADASAGSTDDLRRLVTLVAGLRSRGYPAPSHLATGVASGLAYWIQERLPGTPIQGEPPALPADPQLEAFARALVELADMHAGRGDLPDPPWPYWLLETLEVGGQGYCLHSTMLERDDTARMLQAVKAVASTCAAAPVRRHDVVHFDFSYANTLSDGQTVTGVIDWNVPFTGALQGDYAFDVATLLFYSYDRPSTRSWLWTALLDRTDRRCAALYLAHLVLRQVEWVVRFYPGTGPEERFLSIGAHVLRDIDDLLS